MSQLNARRAVSAKGWDPNCAKATSVANSGSEMKRREFITLVGGAALAWPVAVLAQQPDRIRQIGVLLNPAADDPEGRVAIAAFQEGLQQLGWAEGRNVRIDVRWGGDDVERERRYAVELVALAPDVLLVVDPVGAGFVDALARPGGNATGFMLFEYSFSGKWLELLKQVAPSVTRVAVIRDVSNPSSSGEFVAIQSVGHLLGVEVRPINVGDSGEIERAVAAFARSANGALIVTGSAAVSIHRDLVIALAARHRLPTVYARRSNVVSGGLISYGPDRVELFRRGAGYVDRVLKGEKPADLPVQAPTKFELVINLKTARALGLDIPLSLQQRADEVID
jgi:putative tryptophan/tyrosine transport system substrate-binding protein